MSEQCLLCDREGDLVACVQCGATLMVCMDCARLFGLPNDDANGDWVCVDCYEDMEGESCES